MRGGPVGDGGKAGGDKFVVRGILFKLTKDVALSNGSWLYGGEDESIEFAGKSAGHELRGAARFLHFRPLGLHVPLQTLVEFHGFRMVTL